MPKTQRKLTTIYTSLEDSECAVFDAIARTRGVSRSELAREALKALVDKEEQRVSTTIESRLRSLISDVVAGQNLLSSPPSPGGFSQPHDSNRVQETPIPASNSIAPAEPQARIFPAIANQAGKQIANVEPDNQVSTGDVRKGLEDKFSQIIKRISNLEARHEPGQDPGEGLETMIKQSMESKIQQSLGIQSGSTLKEMMAEVLVSILNRDLIAHLNNSPSEARMTEMLGDTRADVITMSNQVGSLLARLSANDDVLPGQIHQLEERIEQMVTRVVDNKIQSAMGIPSSSNLQTMLKELLESELQKNLKQVFARNEAQLPISDLIEMVNEDIPVLENRLGTLVSRMAVDISMIFLMVWNSQSNDRLKSYTAAHEKAVKRISRWLGELGMEIDLESQPAE